MTAVAEEGRVERETLLRTPYVGLVPFSEAEAAFFFGRSRERRIVASNLKGSRLTLLYGPSGVGKSSLLLAGVVHDLRQLVAEQAGRDGTEPMAVCVLRSWSEEPLQALAEAIRDGVAEALGEQPERWRPGTPLIESLEGWTRGLRRLLIVLDQFEDYFLYHGGRESGRPFLEEFPRILNHASLRVNVLISLREDAWAKLDLFKSSVPHLFANYLRVDYLDRESAREAIVRPIDELNERLRAGEEPYEVEDALVDAVITAAGSGLRLGAADEAGVPGGEQAPIETPFLQLVMERMWRATVEAGARRLTLERLDELGGAQRIVESHLLDALGSLTDREQELAAQAFRYLVTRSRTKIAYSDADIADWSKEPEPEMAAVLEKLSRGESGRILRQVSSNDSGGATSYELFHDVLADPVIEWRKGYEQARELDEQRKRASAARMRRLKRVGLGAGGLLLTVLAGLAGLAFWQSREASDQKEIAEAQALVAQAIGQLDTDPELGLLLATEAAARRKTAETEQALREAVSSQLLRATLPHPGLLGAALSPDGRLAATVGQAGTARLWKVSTGGRIRDLAGHKGPVTRVVFSRRSKRVLTAGDDGTARVWSVAGGAPLVLRHDRSPVAAAVFDTSGDRVLTGDSSARAVIWDARTGKRLHTLAVAEDARAPEEDFMLVYVRVVAFSPDGRRVVTGNGAGHGRLWDATTGALIAELERPDGGRAHGGAILDAAFSRTGRRIVTAGGDGTARVWNGLTGEQMVVLRGHASAVVSAAWNRDGSAIVTGSDDKTARTWDARRGLTTSVVSGHTAPLTTASFAPEDARVLTASQDGTARIESRRSTVLRSGSGVISSATFSADGKLVLTAHAERGARIWQVAGGRSLRSAGALAFSPDGRLLVSNPGDGVIRVTSTNGRGAPIELEGGKEFVNGAAFSPDGRLLAVVADDRIARVWDLGAGRRAARLEHATAVRAAAFSPDGRYLVTGSDSSEASVWDLGTGARRLFPAHTDWIRDVAFNSDGSLVVTGGDDNVAHVWRPTTAQPVGKPLRGHTDWIKAVAFSPDDALIATASDDGTARLWDARTHELLFVLRGHEDWVEDVGFSPDGNEVITASSDQTIRLWSVATGHNLGVFAAIAPLRSAAYAPDGKQILSISESGVAGVQRCETCVPFEQLLALAEARATRRLTAEERAEFLD